jgi:hypothetical protein
MLMTCLNFRPDSPSEQGARDRRGAPEDCVADFKKVARQTEGERIAPVVSEIETAAGDYNKAAEALGRHRRRFQGSRCGRRPGMSGAASHSIDHWQLEKLGHIARHASAPMSRVHSAAERFRPTREQASWTKSFVDTRNPRKPVLPAASNTAPLGEKDIMASLPG